MKNKKPEPLKGKISTLKTEIGDYHYFEIEDVKSAVQGLLEEIEKERKKLGEPCRLQDNEPLYEWAYQDGWIDCLEWILEKIKKWFKGVVE